MRGELPKPWTGTLEIGEGNVSLTDEHGSDRDIDLEFLFMDAMKVRAERRTDCPAYDGPVPRPFWNGTYTHGDNCDCNVWLELSPIGEADRD